MGDRLGGHASDSPAGRARFQDLAVKDDDNAFEDGIVGTSLLEHFLVRLDFARMVLTLENGR